MAKPPAAPLNVEGYCVRCKAVKLLRSPRHCHECWRQLRRPRHPLRYQIGERRVTETVCHGVPLATLADVAEEVAERARRAEIYERMLAERGSIAWGQIPPPPPATPKQPSEEDED